MDGFTILFLVILFIGFVLLVGSFVFLCIGKVATGSGDGNKIEFQGWGLKFSTNLPLVFSLFLGALLIGYPFYEFRKYKESQSAPLNSSTPKLIPVTCKTDYQGAKTLTVYASIEQSNLVNGEGTFQVPVIPSALYTAIGFKGDSGELFGQKTFKLTGNEETYELKIEGRGESTPKDGQDTTPPPAKTDSAAEEKYRLPQSPK